MTRTHRILLLVVLKLLVLGGMLATYAYDMRTGTEIVIRSEPVDPRSLFRGNYVQLAYPVNQVEARLLGQTCLKSGETVFVTLRQTGSAEWLPVAAAATMPADGFTEDRVTLRGMVDTTPDCAEWGGTFRVDYGLSAYFASPEMARALETRLRGQGGLPVILSVPRSGRALIKGVILDGERLLDNEIF